MTNSASSFIAIIFGLAVFVLLVAVGWRSVQNRRILRLQSASGQETIVVAREGDDISSIVTTTETTQPAPAESLVPGPSVVVVNTGVADASPAEFGRSESKSETAFDAETDAIRPGRLGRVVSSAK